MLAQLWSDQFRHFSTLGVAGVGGVLILSQAQLVQLQAWLIILGFFALTATFGILGQISVVDYAHRSELPGKKARFLRGMAAASLGAAGGGAVRLLL